MLSPEAEDALSLLTEALDAEPDFESALFAYWQAGPHAAQTHLGESLGGERRAAAERLRRELPAVTQAEDVVAALGRVFALPEGAPALIWLAATAGRRDIHVTPALAIAAAYPQWHSRVVAAAHERVVSGPLHDALPCAPLLGDGVALSYPENSTARARLEILIWEAGASALEVPGFGNWVFSSPSTFDALIRTPSRGALRGRVLAARCLEISVGSLPPTADPQIVGDTLQVLQPLLLHPEPLVWVHAARALGRLTGQLEQLEGNLLDWALGDSFVLRQRAVTAFASLPASRLGMLGGQLVQILKSRDDEHWALAAIAAATPYLYFERRPIWDMLASRVLAGGGGAVAARALARGLAALFRRGYGREEIEGPFRALREMARRAEPASVEDARRWIEVIATTDPVDGAERDPLDLELGLENLVRVAAQYDDEEADARAARFAAGLSTALGEARRLAIGDGRLRERAAAMNALEGCARSLALRLWAPLLATRPHGSPLAEPSLEETWKTVSRVPAEILDLVNQRRAAGSEDPAADVQLESLAIRLGGYALDACGAATDLGPGRGPTAHDTCLWLRKLDGLVDGSRELPPALEGALSSLFWRVVDTTRGTALGEVDDVEWLGPFAAWWALVIDRPAVLTKLTTALPMMSPAALTTCCDRAEVLRTVVASGEPDGAWGDDAAAALASLHADKTELSVALAGLASALAEFSLAAGPKPELDALCVLLVHAADRLHAALADPVKALHPAGADADDPPSRVASVNAPRVAGLVARAVRGRDLAMVDVWLASLGPVTSGLVEEALSGALRRTPPPPPGARKREAKLIEGYELVKALGEGGIGSVWLVRKPGADRLFVLKIPKADALASATDVEREGIIASFVEEAKALAGLYHPNVANIIDRGVSEGMPYLVLEYLIGADLKQYSSAKLMTLFELRQVVLESCAGLAALHGAGLVHRDIKPANIWLRLPLAGGERFDPHKHRDPAVVPPLSSVVIDFGMVRAIRVPPEVGGRFVAGTAGYIAPEQVLDPVELDPRADVYALAGTIYNVTTGRAFFDEIENPRDRIIAHMRTDPFEDPERLRAFPAGVARVLRAATAIDPAARPHPLELGREFVAAL
ncbi:MAG: serine/threonine protein kinase [Polyangiaceae bacterium]|nr:serine/threonine protein kinase [Polyangiaceae bacterium]